MDGHGFIVLFPEQLEEEYRFEQHTERDHADAHAVQDLTPEGQAELFPAVGISAGSVEAADAALKGPAEEPRPVTKCLSPGSG